MATPKLKPGAELNRQMEYYDLKKNWRKVRPHLADKELNDILVEDFNKYTFGIWRKKFTHERLPSEFDCCDWRWSHRGRYPAFWSYACHSACHWVVNFSLRLAMLVMPDKPWRIITSPRHSTVWDGGELLFDLNWQAIGFEPNECFDDAFEKELQPGEYREVGFAEHWTVDKARREFQTTSISPEMNQEELNDPHVMTPSRLLVLHVAAKYRLRHDEMGWLADGYNWGDRPTLVHSPATVESLVKAGYLKGNNRGEKVALRGQEGEPTPVPMLRTTDKGRALIAEMADAGLVFLFDDERYRVIVHAPAEEIDGIDIEQYFSGWEEIELGDGRVLILIDEESLKARNEADFTHSSQLGNRAKQHAPA